MSFLNADRVAGIAVGVVYRRTFLYTCKATVRAMFCMAQRVRVLYCRVDSFVYSVRGYACRPQTCIIA